MSIIKRKIKRIKHKFKYIFYREEILGRNILIACLAIGLFVLFISLKLKQGEEPLPAEENTDYQELETPVSDTTNWKIYKNDWYGFQMKYPEYLSAPTPKRASKGDKWEYRLEFRKIEADENNPIMGFDLVIYNVKKVKKLTDTEEYPAFKFEMNENETCRFIPSQSKVEPKFFAVDMYVSPTDDCYKQTFFYSFIRDEYIYNIIPVSKENRKAPANFKRDTIYNFPEFFSIIPNFSLIAFKQVPAQPPQPVVRRGAKCPKENDHPSVSSTKSKNHMDEDCCPDFDEWPKLKCFYTAKDYAIMLSGPTSGHKRK